MEERLQKLMAHAGLGSRREIEKWIEAGRVMVNGRIAALGDKANPLTDAVTLDGAELDLNRERMIYIALHKPAGVISSLEDEMQQGRATVRDMIDVPGHLYPVGRLDKQSEGLMLMTNDGDLAYKLTHPRYGHEKTYDVTVAGDITDAALEEWRWGVMLDEDVTAPAEITVLERHGSHTRLEVILHEGKKRQIRRIAAGLGHPVLRLVRLKIGPLTLGSLEPGKWRFLRPREVSALRRTVQERAKGEAPRKPFTDAQRSPRDVPRRTTRKRKGK
ncbi:MAG: rRNA pseudouridine synthase [Anaerolineales bacterium]|nr:rRNA pseudouridine synthase [Anaerolineales bacterium]